MPTPYQHILNKNKHLVEEFILHGKGGGSLTISEPKVFFFSEGKLAEQKTEPKPGIRYKKIEVIPESGIYIINRDGRYVTTVLQGTVKQIKEGVRTGLATPKSMPKLVEIVASAGQYERIVLDRIVEENQLIGRLHDEKLKLLKFTQERLIDLYPLQRLLNHYDEGKSFQDNFDEIIQLVGKLHHQQKQSLKQVKNKNSDDEERSSEPNPEEKKILLDKLEQNIETLIIHTENYSKSLEVFKEKNLDDKAIKKILRPYHLPSFKSLSLQHFLQEQINIITQSAMDANYKMSIGFGLGMGGSLSVKLFDSQVRGEEFSSEKIDYHNPVQTMHQFNFGDENQIIALDLRKCGFFPKNNAELAREIYYLWKLKKGHLPKALKALDERKNEKLLAGPHKNTLGPNWHFTKYSNPIVTPLIWLWNGIVDTIGIIADFSILLPLVLYITNKWHNLHNKNKKRFAPPSEYINKAKIDRLELAYAEIDHSGLTDAEIEQTKKIINGSITDIRPIGRAERIIRFFSRQVFQFGIDPLKMLGKKIAKFFLNIGAYFNKFREYIRYELSGKLINDKEILNLLLEESKKKKTIEDENGKNETDYAPTYATAQIVNSQDVSSNEKNNVSTDKISHSHNSENALDVNDIQNGIQGATVPYHLMPDDPSDFASWFSGGFTKPLMEVFSNEFYRAHPMGGFAFSAAGITAIPMVFPSLLAAGGGWGKFFQLIYTHISAPIAKTLVGSTEGFTAAFSTSLIQGKVALLAVDIFNGKDSLTVLGLRELLENPLVAAGITITSCAIGYAAVFKMGIPGMKEIAKETAEASFPWFELGFTGAKLSVVLAESVITHGHHEGKDHIQRMLAKEKAEIRKWLAQILKNLSENQLDEAVEKYCKLIQQEVNKPDVRQQLKDIVDTNSYWEKLPNDQKSELSKQFLENCYRQAARANVLSLDPQELSVDQKFKIMHYVRNRYASDPVYVKAVDHHLNKETRYGPAAETIKITLSYIPALLRALVSAVVSLSYAIGWLWYKTNLSKEKANPSEEKADAYATRCKVAIFGVKKLLNKAKLDLGRVVKSIATILRVSWAMTASMLLLPLSVIAACTIWPVKKIFSFFGAPFENSYTLVAVYSFLSKAFFAPGKVSQFIDWCVGMLREGATAKHLRLATYDMDRKEEMQFNQKFNTAFEEYQNESGQNEADSADGNIKEMRLSEMSASPSFNSVVPNDSFSEIDNHQIKERSSTANIIAQSATSTGYSQNGNAGSSQTVSAQNLLGFKRPQDLAATQPGKQTKTPLLQTDSIDKCLNTLPSCN